VKTIIDAGVKISIGSDAHDINSISRARNVTDFLAELGCDESQLWRPE